MTKANTLLAATNAGEFSPRMEGRVDINQYPNAAARIENFLVAPQGALIKRPGTRFIAETSGVDFMEGPGGQTDSGFSAALGDGPTNTKNRGSKYTSRVSGTVQSARTFINAVSTSFDAQVSVYTDSGGSPNTQVGGNSDSTNIAASGEKIFTWSSNAPVLTFGTVYWIVISDVSGGSGSATMRVVNSTSDFASGAHDTITSITGTFITTQDLDLNITVSSDSPARLIPFSFSTEQSYALEFGHKNINFYTNQGVLGGSQNAPSVTNGTFDSDISGWTDWSAGTGSISHSTITIGPYAGTGAMNMDGDGSSNEAKARQAITIDSADIYKTHVIQFNVIPLNGFGIQFQVSNSPGDASIYSATFEHGIHTVSFIPETTTFYIEFIRDGNLVTYIDDVEFIGTSQFSMNSAYDSNDLFNLHYAQSADSMYITSARKPTHVLERRGPLDWSLRQVFWHDGPYLDKNTTSTTANPTGTTGLVTVVFSSTEGINGGTGFTTYDIGRLFRQEHGADSGYGVVYDINSTTSVDVRLVSDLSASTANANWWLGAWSEETGFPETVSFVDQRLVFGANRNQPQTIWMSQSGDLENFRPDSLVSGALTVEDDDAVTFTIAARQVNKIQWLASSRNFIAGTSGGEWAISSDGPTITPSDIQVNQHSNVGSTNIQPLNIGNHILFIQRDLQTVNDLKFSFEDDAFVTTDLTLPADHIGKAAVTTDDAGFKQVAYQQDPDSVAWFVRNDGQLCGLTFKPGELVSGWTRHINGEVQSICTIPGENGGGRTFDSGDRDELWMIVKRTIDGATKLYVEMMEGNVETDIKPDFGTNTFIADDAFYVDSGLTYDGASTGTLSGLDHLEGETVAVNGNGKDLGTFTVSSGSITLGSNVTKAQVGLPYNARYLSLKPVGGARAGTPVGKKKRFYGISFVLLDSYDFKLGDGEAEADSSLYKDITMKVDEIGGVQPLFTGERHTSSDWCGAWSTDPRISIFSDTPLPLNILAMAPEMEIHDTK